PRRECGSLARPPRGIGESRRSPGPVESRSLFPGHVDLKRLVVQILARYTNCFRTNHSEAELRAVTTVETAQLEITLLRVLHAASELRELRDTADWQDRHFDIDQWHPDLVLDDDRELGCLDADERLVLRRRLVARTIYD